MGMVANLLRVSGAELETYLSDSIQLEERIYTKAEQEGSSLVDIDKSWDGILFLLTGKGLSDASHPLARVLFSGQLIDEEQDLGYGPAHYLTPEQVQEVNNEIAALSKEDLRGRFDAGRMTELEIYPGIWDEGDDAFDYVADNFQSLQQLYADAARKQETVIAWLS